MALPVFDGFGIRENLELQGLAKFTQHYKFMLFGEIKDGTTSPLQLNSNIFFLNHFIQGWRRFTKAQKMVNDQKFFFLLVLREPRKTNDINEI